VINVGRSISRHSLRSEMRIHYSQMQMYNQVCIFCYVHLPDRGLVEPKFVGDMLM